MHPDFQPSDPDIHLLSHDKLHRPEVDGCTPATSGGSLGSKCSAYLGQELGGVTNIIVSIIAHTGGWLALATS
jgi:hypothetical protein